jgi:uncharacterized protein YcnI
VHPVRRAALVAAAAALLALPGSAAAHPVVTPSVVQAKAGEFFTLAIPTEEENATTTKVELTVPDGINIDSFAPAAGFTREVQASGSGEEAHISRVTWTGTGAKTDEDTVFGFIAETASTGTLQFGVKQTYSDGKVVQWDGAAGSDTPAPTVEVRSSLGGGSSSTLAIVGVALGALALLVAIGGVAVSRGKRALA